MYAEVVLYVIELLISMTDGAPSSWPAAAELSKHSASIKDSTRDAALMVRKTAKYKIFSRVQLQSQAWLSVL